MMRYYIGSSRNFTITKLDVLSFHLMNIVHLSNLCLFQVKVVTGKDGQAVTPVAIATQLPPNVSAAFSVQQQFQVIDTRLFKHLLQ